MQMLKIVVTGPFVSGKSTFVRSVCDPAANEPPALHETTTGLDIGIIAVTPEIELHLHGTPGQERFSFMWEVLADSCVGYIMLIDSRRPTQINDTWAMLQRFASFTDAPYVIGATYNDDPTALPPDYIRKRLHLNDNIPLIACNAASRSSAKRVLLALLEQIAARRTPPHDLV